MNMEPKVHIIMITIPPTMPNRPGIDQKIVEKTNPIKNIKRSLIHAIV